MKEIVQNIINLLQSSFVEDNYDEINIHNLFNDMIEYACDECEDNDIEYTKEEIEKLFEKSCPYIF